MALQQGDRVVLNRYPVEDNDPNPNGRHGRLVVLQDDGVAHFMPDSAEGLPEAMVGENGIVCLVEELDHE